MADESCEAVVESMAEVKVNGEGSVETGTNGKKKKEKQKKPAKTEKDPMKGNSVRRSGHLVLLRLAYVNVISNQGLLTLLRWVLRFGSSGEGN
mmetsp:Transcript_35858/g.143306  ORF Transcript_35858/g.143306 Transcript_35858/m.143306 type:complete len:93 (+) Transcript_35858:38-316(+)